MLKRLAFFEGQIRSGCEAEFDADVNERLLPLWRQFPGSAAIEILREIDAADGGHRYPMVLAISFPDANALSKALL
jgi:hypothetical protein